MSRVFDPMEDVREALRKSNEIVSLDYLFVVDRFIVVLDGNIVLFAAPCKPGDHVDDFPLAREILVQIMREKCKFAVIPPNVTGAHLNVLNAGRAHRMAYSPWRSEMQLKERSSIRKAMRIIYNALAHELSLFYIGQEHQLSNQESLDKIHRNRRELLSALTKLSAINAFVIWRRRHLTKEINLKITTLLETLTEHGFHLEQLSQDRRALSELLKENLTARTFLERNLWEVQLEGGKADLQSTLAMVEHAQSETQISGVVSITIWAAIVGALAATVFTGVLKVIETLLSTPVPTG